MNAIYEPKGRALEYSPLACNLYLGCEHGCRYCYAPGCMRKTMEQWHSVVEAREGILSAFDKDCRAMAKNRINDEDHRVLFCFLSDPYQPIEGKLHLTRQAIEKAKSWLVKVSVLTKGKYSLVSQDFDLMREADVHLGVTLSFVNDRKRKQWEPNASSVSDRLKILKEAHKRGIYTWVSMEPVIDAKEALAVIDKAHDVVSYWKVGKLNHDKENESKVDWHQFYVDVKAKLDRYGAQYYIKDDLKAFA